MDRKYIETEKVEMPELTFFQRLRLRLFGKVCFGLYKLPGWMVPLPFYVFECEKHGEQVSRPHGHPLTFKCPICYG